MAHALKTTPITAPRGPVRLSTVVDAPIQNIYICKVENVHGTLEDVPIKTYPNVQPWGTLPYQTWLAEYTSRLDRAARAVITAAVAGARRREAPGAQCEAQPALCMAIRRTMMI